MICIGPKIEKRTTTVPLTDRIALLVVKQQARDGFEIIITAMEKRKRGRWRFAKPMPHIPGDAIPALIDALIGGGE